MNHFREELSKIMGFYDFSGKPTVVSPWHAGNPRPDMTAIHESIHRDLANTTSTGMLAKFINILISGDVKSASTNLHSRLSLLFNSILEGMRLTHEAAATYLSLLVFHSMYSSDAARFESTLPAFYRDAVSHLERAFGRARGHRDDVLVTQTQILALSKIALSPPCLELACDLSDTQRISRCIEVHSPDKRFTSILDRLLSRGDLSRFRDLTIESCEKYLGKDWRGIVDHSPGQSDAEELSDLKKIASALPSINADVLSQFSELAPFTELPTEVLPKILKQRAEELLRSWELQCQALGIQALKNLEIRWPAKKSLVEAHDVNYAVPLPGPKNMTEFVPKDRSLAYSYEPKKPNEVDQILKTGVPRDFFLVLNISLDMRTRPETGALRVSTIMGYFWYVGEEDPDRANVRHPKPFVTYADLFFLVRALKSMDPKKVALKIDERNFEIPGLERTLCRTGLPIFVNCFDSSAKHLQEIIEREASRGERVFVSPHSLGKPGAAAMVISNGQGPQVWIVLLSEVVFKLLRSIFSARDEIVFIEGDSGEAKTLAYLPTSKGLLYTVLLSTYC